MTSAVAVITSPDYTRSEDDLRTTSVALASLSLAQESDPAGFVARFAGDDSAVAASLVTVVLGRQSEDHQQFLLYTSVVAELTAELAAALSNRADAGALLDQMAQANALVQGR